LEQTLACKQSVGAREELITETLEAGMGSFAKLDPKILKFVAIKTRTFKFWGRTSKIKELLNVSLTKAAPKNL
jgi:hypothetical protein